MTLRRQTSQDLRDLFEEVLTDCSDNDVANDSIDDHYSENDEAGGNLLNQLDETDNEGDVGDDDDVAIEEEEEEEEDVPGRWYNSQNKNFGRKWNANPPAVSKIRSFHIFKESYGLTPKGSQNMSKHLQVFQQIFPEPLVNVIVAETNRKAREYCSKDEPKSIRWYNTNSNEIYCMIGVLMYAGAHKNWDEKLDELYSEDNRPFYRAAISQHRLKQLLRFLRFDNYQTRQERLKTDKLAPIRDVWNMSMENIRLPYKPSSYLTIDEQLVLTRGRCSFRQYIPSKPGKYGIKIFWTCDAKNVYPLTAEIYVGRQPNEPRSTEYALNLVHRLVQPYINKGRTVTMDNFFTSCKLAEQLVLKKTTLIGTIRSNKPDIPKEFAHKSYIKERPEGSSRFCFNEHLTLVSYTPKKGKNVLLLSTLHNDDGIDLTSNKPNIILDYNSTKGGVDTLDKLVRTYTCKRKTKRWPMVLFFNMIDVGAIAAFKLFKLANPQMYIQRVSSERKLFLKELAMQLVNSYILERLAKPQVMKRSVKTAMHQIGYKVIEQRPSLSTFKAAGQKIPTSSRPRCYLCPRTADTKTRIRCHSCEKPTCSKHTKTICDTCVNPEALDSDEEQMDDASP